MTRINCIKPSELVRQHLISEYRELPRVFSLVRKAQDKGLQPSDIKAPRRYTLGTGHVKFFYDKLGYLVKRQQALIDEMQRRL